MDAKVGMAASNGFADCGARTASNEMCTFLVMNISSLQLIPVNIIAYRSQYGSANPAAVIAPAIVATFFSTVVAVIYCKLMDRKQKNITLFAFGIKNVLIICWHNLKK